MSRKIVWLTFWVTLTYWLGGVMGCAGPSNQNFKALEDDHRPRMEPEQPEHLEAGVSDARQAETTYLTFLQDEQPPEAPEPQDVPDTPAPPVAPQPTDSPEPAAAPDTPEAPEAPAAPIEPVPGAEAGPYEPLRDPSGAPPTREPSLTGLDRSHWPRVVVGPAVGVTIHEPVYYRDILLEPDPVPVTQAGDTPAQIDAALADREAETWTTRTAADLLVQPVKFALDTALLPIKAIIDPPWSDARTPEYDGPFAIEVD